VLEAPEFPEVKTSHKRRRIEPGLRQDISPCPVAFRHRSPAFHIAECRIPARFSCASSSAATARRASLRIQFRCRKLQPGPMRGH